MKRIFFAFICMCIFLSGCAGQDDIDTKDMDSVSETAAESSANDILKKGDAFSVMGIVDYSDEPSDIGQEYCFITGGEKIEYTFMDIYDQESKWASEVFFTQGDDTDLLKNYVGREITVSGIFDAECHGIPYITNITILDE